MPVNASVIIGYRMAGIAGSLTAIAGTILPPMIIISLISLCYEQFRTNEIVALALQVTRAGVAAVILDVTLNLAGNIIKLHNAGDDDSLLYRRSIFQCKRYGSDPHLPGSRDCKRRNHQSQKGGSIG